MVSFCFEINLQTLFFFYATSAVVILFCFLLFEMKRFVKEMFQAFINFFFRGMI